MIFLPYEQNYPVAAAVAVYQAVRGTSTLTLNEKLNAVYDVASFGLGQAFPVSAAPPTPPPAPGPLKGKKMSPSDLADILDAHCGRSDSERASVAAAGSLNWPAIVAALLALAQSLIAAGV